MDMNSCRFKKSILELNNSNVIINIRSKPILKNEIVELLQEFTKVM